MLPKGGNLPLRQQPRDGRDPNLQAPFLILSGDLGSNDSHSLSCLKGGYVRNMNI